MDGHRLRAAIYARVSSDQQTKDQTIASQVEALRERIGADGLALEEELTFIDDGYSGGTLVRPALERLRDVAYAGGLDCLYVHSPDRLARKYAYQVILVEELKRYGVEIVFLNHAAGSSPEEELLLQMQGMIAEYERAKILERSRRGKRHAARRGGVHVLAAAPYGYRYISKQAGGGQAHYQVIEDEARVVKQVFEWVGRDGLSLRAVRRRLNEAGVPTRTGKSRWGSSSVAAMLRNPAYKGEAAYGKTRVGPRLPRLRPPRGKAEPGLPTSVYRTAPEEQEPIPVPALVSADLFAAVAEQLAENKKRKRARQSGARHLLQGLVVCPGCGYAYHGLRTRSAKKEYRYYRCSGADARHPGGERLCDNKQVHAEALEDAVWADVSALLRDPGRVEAEYERRLNREEAGGSWESKQLADMIGKVRRGIARLIDAYEDGLLQKPEFEPRVQRARERLARLEAEAEAQAGRERESDDLRLVLGQLQAFAEQVGQRLESADWQTRREIIRALVKRVEIGPEEARIVYRVTPRPFDRGPARGTLPDCTRRGRPMRERRSPGFVAQGRSASARRRPGYPLVGCTPAEPTSVSPGTVRLSQQTTCSQGQRSRHRDRVRTAREE
jgi:site-specific DNA recombinase